MNSYKNLWISLGLSTLAACSKVTHWNSKVTHSNKLLGEPLTRLPTSRRVNKHMQRDACKRRLRTIKKTAKVYSTRADSEQALDDINQVIDEDNMDLIKFKYLVRLGKEEFLAHEWVYNGALAHSNQIQLLDGFLYDIVPIQTAHPGICGFMLTRKNYNFPRMRVVFRGTKCWYSMLRNLECLLYGSAGIRSFNGYKDAIINQISNQLIDYQNRIAHHCLKTRKTHRQVSLSISGHSLGGADAQNTTHAILQAMTHQADKKEGFFALRKVTLYHFNSTGVPKKIADACKSYVKEIHQNRLNIKIESHSLLVDGDPIQSTGEANLFDDVNPDKVGSQLSQLYKFEQKVKPRLVDRLWNPLRAHYPKLLLNEANQKDYICKILSNISLEEAKAITKELRTKFSLLNYISSLLKKVRLKKSLNQAHNLSSADRSID